MEKIIKFNYIIFTAGVLFIELTRQLFGKQIRRKADC